MSDLQNLGGVEAIVTGAAGGIGLEFAKVLARKKADLILIDISQERLEEAQKEINKIIVGNRESQNQLTPGSKQKVHLLRLNLADGDIVEQIENYCATHGLDPKILINNAGIFSFQPISESDPKRVELFVDLHVRAVTMLSQWFVSRRKLTGEGWMLNMSSMSCWMPMPGLAMYASTKSYIRVFSRALHYEMKDYGIGVTVACPGGIATDLFGLPEKWKKFAVAIGVLQTPEAFARKAVGKMLKKKKQYINGLLNRFSIFFIGIQPTWVRMMVKHKLLDKGITR